MEKKFKTAFVCTKCGSIHPRWQGQCRECGEWNTLAEERIVKSSSGKRNKNPEVAPQKLNEIGDEYLHGYETGLKEFDRVLGDGLLPGSAVLLAGEPGIGKSTLILQAADYYSEKDLQILYVTGEESLNQLKKRARRLAIQGRNIDFLNQNSLDEICSVIENNNYHIVIVDSIQTIANVHFDSPPGTVGQIRETSGRLIEIAKKRNIALFLIGHVTKEGLIAGPKVMEHIVDAVLSFEGDSRFLFRILRPTKNRFGSTFELGVFEMTVDGLKEVSNPSMFFLSDYGNSRRSGTVVAASCEGNRPILVEIQALVSSASYGTPQRVAGGLDNKRLALLLAILEKRAGIPMGGNDVFVSVAGGLKLNEPAVDLAILAAIVSSLRDIPIDNKTVFVGEVGLSGEVRPVGMIERRVAEAARLGFEKMIVPQQNVEAVAEGGINITGVDSLDSALEILF